MSSVIEYASDLTGKVSYSIMSQYHMNKCTKHAETLGIGPIL